MTISNALQDITKKLRENGVPAARLDAEVLLAHTLGVDRSWLHAHGEKELGSEEVRKLESFVERRLQREPVAYITGGKEFYGREFSVTPDVLIPRPETEALVELALAFYKEAPCKAVDVGCGSGCIGITLKLERPEWDVTLSDISPAALAVAKSNAEKLSAKVTLIESDLLSSFFLHPSSFSMIIANLPYVDVNWETSPETAFEPEQALYAENKGLKLVEKLIEQSCVVLNEQGVVVLEADPEQHEAIKKAAARQKLSYIQSNGYALAFMKQSRA